MTASSEWPKGSPWSRYPDKTETEIIRSKCRDAGMKESAIDVEPFEAFQRGECNMDTLDLWIQEQKGNDEKPGRRSHLFVDFAGGQFDLEREGFEQNNMTARAKLVNLIGLADASARAKDWGLDGISDITKGKAKRPDHALVALNEQKRKLERNIARDTAALETINNSTPDVDKAAIAHGTNPWAKGASWNLTEQGRIVKRLGVEKARAIARSAGIEPNF
jgi:hypothetical protein